MLILSEAQKVFLISPEKQFTTESRSLLLLTPNLALFARVTPELVTDYLSVIGRKSALF